MRSCESAPAHTRQHHPQIWREQTSARPRRVPYCSTLSCTRRRAASHHRRCSEIGSHWSENHHIHRAYLLTAASFLAIQPPGKEQQEQRAAGWNAVRASQRMCQMDEEEDGEEVGTATASRGRAPAGPRRSGAHWQRARARTARAPCGAPNLGDFLHSSHSTDEIGIRTLVCGNENHMPNFGFFLLWGLGRGSVSHRGLQTSGRPPELWPSSVIPLWYPTEL
jgi:hypothetical protein